MPKFQLLAAAIQLANDPQQVIHRDKFDPITLPEAMTLRAIHGGESAVHSLVSVGAVERSFAEERERLNIKYGPSVVSALFPPGVPSLPTADESLPTQDEIDAGLKAAAEAQTKAREKAEEKRAAKAAAVAAAAAAAAGDKSKKKTAAPADDPLAALGGKDK